MAQKKLALGKQTLRRLDDAALEEKAGGITLTVTASELGECTSTCLSECPTMCHGDGFSCGRTCTMVE